MKCSLTDSVCLCLACAGPMGPICLSCLQLWVVEHVRGARLLLRSGRVHSTSLRGVQSHPQTKVPGLSPSCRRCCLGLQSDHALCRPNWSTTARTFQPCITKHTDRVGPMEFHRGFHRGTLTVLRTLLRANVTSVDAVCHRLPSTIALEIWKRTARQFRSCCPCRWDAFGAGVLCAVAGIRSHLS